MSIINKIAIDPGYSGAIAYEYDDGVVDVDKMPKTMYDIFNYFKQKKNEGIALKSHVIVEKVGAMPGNGVKAMWTFSENATSIKLGLYAARISFDQVTPQSWMKKLGTQMPKEKNARKNKIKMIVQEKYPHIKATLWNADALAMLSTIE